MLRASARPAGTRSRRGDRARRSDSRRASLRPASPSPWPRHRRGPVAWPSEQPDPRSASAAIAQTEASRVMASTFPGSCEQRRLPCGTRGLKPRNTDSRADAAPESRQRRWRARRTAEGPNGSVRGHTRLRLVRRRSPCDSVSGKTVACLFAVRGALGVGIAIDRASTTPRRRAVCWSTDPIGSSGRPGPRPGRLLAAQFRSVVVLLLIGASGLSVLLGDYADAVAIGIVVALNAGIGFVIEVRARQAMRQPARSPGRTGARRPGRTAADD